MTVYQVLADPGKMRRLAQLALFLPSMVPIVDRVHAALPDSSPAERRAAALAFVERLVVMMQKRGYVSADMLEGLHETINDLYEMVLVAGLAGD